MRRWAPVQIHKVQLAYLGFVYAALRPVEDFVASELAWWLSCMCDVEVWHAKGDDSCPAHVQNHCSGATLALSTPAQTLTYASSNKNTNCVSRSHHP
jgi:hypothetical protein